MEVCTEMPKDQKNSKTRQKHSIKDEIGKKFLSLTPGLPERLAKGWKEIEHFDGRNAATIMSKMQAIGEGYSPKSTGREAKTLGEIRELLLPPSLQQEMRQELKEMIRHVKREAFTDRRASLLLKLISKADARLPFISLALLMNHAHPIKSLRPQCEPADLIAEAERRTGERRARSVIRAYRETAEWLYDPYLRTLWALTCFARNEWQPEPKKFGGLVVQLSRKLKDYPGLVEEDAGWRRNAAAHGPNWEYVCKDDSINMQDDRHPWSNISVGDLYTKVLSMYWIAGPTLARVGQL